MAEEAKTLILSLQFDTEEGLKRAGDFRAAIDADKASLEELNKTIKKNGESTAEQRIQREKLEQSIKANTKSRTDELRAVESYIKATKNSIDANGKYNGSITNLRGNLGFLTAKWNDLTKEERENAKVGGVMQKEIKKLSDELKDLEGSVGDNRRSVGSYLDAIRQAPGAMGKMKAGMEGLNMAMKANPIGLLTDALRYLPQLLNSSGEGADFFAKVMSVVNAVIQEGLKRLVALGGAFVKLYNGDFKGAFEQGRGALTGFTNSVTSAVRAGGALADRLDALENAESRFAAASSKARLEIDKLNAQSKNRTLSEKERGALLEQAIKKEQELNKQAIKLAQERMALIKEENRVNQGDEDEEIKRINEQQEKINELEGQSLVLLEKLQNRKEALEDAEAERAAKRREKQAADAEKAEAKRVKAAEEALKREEDYKKLVQETGEKEYQNALKSLENYLTDQETALKNAQALELENAGGNKEAIKKINEDYAEIFKEIELKRIEAQKVINTDYGKETIDLDAKIADMRLKAAQEYQNKLTNNEAKGAEKRKALKEAEFQAAVDITNGFAALSSIIGGESEQAAEFQKAIALFQIGLDAARSISQIVTLATAPTPDNIATGGATVPFKIIGLSAAVLANIAQARKLISEDTPKAPKSKFAEGGLLSGPSHAEGGIKGTGSFGHIEVEGGESVINKRSTAMFAPILSAINQLGGGKPLANTNYAAMGGYINVAATQSISNSKPVMDYDKLAKAMSKQPIYVIPTEIKAKANAADARKAQAGLGQKAA